jgi:protein phosphatase inhibitor 2
MPVKWDEGNLEANAEEATAANRMQITEPKTPFHYLGDDGEPEAYPPKAAPATAAPREAKQAASRQVQPGMDLSKLASAALERREEQPEPEDEPEGATAHRIAAHPATDAHGPRSRADKRRKFDQQRKVHYQTGGLAALRAQAAAAMAEEEEEDDDEEDDTGDGNKT